MSAKRNPISFQASSPQVESSPNVHTTLVVSCTLQKFLKNATPTGSCNTWYIASALYRFTAAVHQQHVQCSVSETMFTWSRTSFVVVSEGINNSKHIHGSAAIGGHARCGRVRYRPKIRCCVLKKGIGSSPIQVRFRWFKSGAGMVQVRFRSGSSGPGPGHVWFKSGSGLVRVWLRSG